jgi:hypothetical protein
MYSDDGREQSMLDIQMRKKQQKIEYEKSLQYISKYHPNVQPTQLSTDGHNQRDCGLDEGH